MPSDLSLLYDGTFEGFLTTVFQAAFLKITPHSIESSDRFTPNLLSNPLPISTDPEKAERVWSALVQRAGYSHASMVRGAFLSEIPGIEMQIWHFQRKLFADKSGTFCGNVLDEHVTTVLNTARKVQHEAHLHQGFVRFQVAPDGMSYAMIEPTYNIVELLASHFSARFPNMPWLIVDGKRLTGIHYDGNQVQQIQLSEKPTGLAQSTSANPGHTLSDNPYQDLWKSYYRAINIPERKNTKLMLRLMPRKYWKYLPERNA
jgi:probable DNA metabolism protein